MKRNAEAECNSTKRIILGVQRLALRPSKRSPSPLSLHSSSMEIIYGHFGAGTEISSDSDEANHSQSSSQDSDLDYDYPRRTRSNSEPKSGSRKRREVDDFSRSRTWSLPRISQLQQEAKHSVGGVVTTVFPRKVKVRLARRASDPPRFRNLLEVANEAGYSGGCECDSDMEEQILCPNCSKEMGINYDYAF